MHYGALMDEDTAALAGRIGARVRQGRQAQRRTLDQLAEAAGVSRRMVVNVEQGVVNPSIGTLLRLGDALGLSLPALVGEPQPASVVVTRRGEGAVLWRGDSGGRGVLLAAAADTPDACELWEWTLHPGEQRVSEPHEPGTRELIHVREGTLTVTTDGRATTLAAGDAVAFPGDVAHSYADTHDEPVRFVLTVFEPGAARATRAVGDV